MLRVSLSLSLSPLSSLASSSASLVQEPFIIAIMMKFLAFHYSATAAKDSHYTKYQKIFNDASSHPEHYSL